MAGEAEIQVLPYLVEGKAGTLHKVTIVVGKEDGPLDGQDRGVVTVGQEEVGVAPEVGQKLEAALQKL